MVLRLGSLLVVVVVEVRDGGKVGAIKGGPAPPVHARGVKRLSTIVHMAWVTTPITPVRDR